VDRDGLNFVVFMTFEALTSQMMKLAVFRDAWQCSLANMNKRFVNRIFCHHFMDMDLQSIGIYTRLYGVTS